MRASLRVDRPLDARIPTIDEEEALRTFILEAFGIQIPDVRCCRDHVSPWRAFADAYFGRAPVAVWKASRGMGGKSTLLAVLSLTEAITLRAHVNLLGGSAQQSARVLEEMEKLWAHPGSPQDLVARRTKIDTVFVGGHRIQALPASPQAVRGPHPQRLRLDEIDEMDLGILDAAMGQPMGARGVVSQVVLSSTHHHADGTMTEILRRAIEKGWPVHEWCYRENLESPANPKGWLDQVEVERKRAQMTQAQWEVEVDLQEPAPENRAIVTSKVEGMFRAELGETAEDLFEAEPPVPSAQYVHGADWARKRDWTVFWVLRVDVSPMRFVYFRRLQRGPLRRAVDPARSLARRWPACPSTR